ncbi:MAG: IS630 family transposase, partial [Verrucomicrobiales bacterium]|nr:IS630 family transposase [Verrucomicrobiales bacterium]
HGDASLYKAFLPAEARRIADRIERHHTPVHGSWLNLAEMEISVLCRTTLTDRFKNIDEMRRLCALGVERRNDAAVITNWQFSTADARTKLHRLYPSTQY